MSDKKKYDLGLIRRPRRLRQTLSLRSITQETHLEISKLVQPLFVINGEHCTESVESMPGINRYSIDLLVKECKKLIDLGLGGVALFPKVDSSLKCNLAKEALNPNSLIYLAISELRKNFPELTIIADLALDPYTKNGHDGIFEVGGVSPLNDATVEIIEEMAILSARAGATMVAPSDMMDGRVAAVRSALDANGFKSTLILAYSAKFASAFYGPFRDAIGSKTDNSKTEVDKSTYQINPPNRREALLELGLDEDEGADILMVKPAGPYLDIIREARESTELPIAAYQVSGEYSQMVAAAERGWLDLKSCRDESLIAIKRSGADIILSYFAKDYAIDLSE